MARRGNCSLESSETMLTSNKIKHPTHSICPQWHVWSILTIERVDEVGGHPTLWHIPGEGSGLLSPPLEKARKLLHSSAWGPETRAAVRGAEFQSRSVTVPWTMTLGLQATTQQKQGLRSERTPGRGQGHKSSQCGAGNSQQSRATAQLGSLSPFTRSMSS